MLLHKITLTNIRSYQKETIVFPAGSILLSGDIGSGKSSILLGVEFALFGASRPDLPAEALLRRGVTQGSVELECTINGKNVVIKRNLKKENEAIKQVAGYIIINDVKKELTPVELKAEVIGLLGYPEDVLSKNKNYIFRFTVYTPQEEMKYILQENAETRLDVLRRVFNVDKYKNIRENVQMYLRQLRVVMAQIEGLVAPLEQYGVQRQQIGEEKKKADEGLEKIMPAWRQIQRVVEEKREELEKMEKIQRLRQELVQQEQMMIAGVNQKKIFLERLQGQCREILGELNALQIPEGREMGQVVEEIRRAEIEKNHLMQRRSNVGERLRQIVQRITLLTEEVTTLERQVGFIDEKENALQQLMSETEGKEELRQKKNQVDELLEKTLELMTKNKTLLDAGKELQLKIIGLHECPTCLQEVTNEHKERIVVSEQQRISVAESLLQELQHKREQVLGQREEIRIKLEQLMVREAMIMQIRLELTHLREMKRSLGDKQERLRQLAQENTFLNEQWQGLEREGNVEEWLRKIRALQELQQLLLKQQYLQNTQRGLQEQEQALLREIEQLQIDTGVVRSQKEGMMDYSGRIVLLRQELLNEIAKEREGAVEVSKIQMLLETIHQREGEIISTIERLEQEKRRLVRTKELYSWLEDYFVPLTYTIEKHIMVRIHRLFSELFAEWFSILIEDENVYARIDDAFTPIIEQNGYEVGFSMLSGGERTSAALAYRLALNRVIHDILQEVHTKSLLILDEPTDGFSSEQLDKVRDVLERMPLEQTIIVSHEPKIETFVEHVIRVRKNGHVSVVGG